MRNNNFTLPINYSSLVETWVVYRKEVFNESIADILGYIERETGKKMDRDNFLKYRKLERSPTDGLIALIDNEFFDLLRWLSKRLGIELSDANIEGLCNHLTLPAKKSARLRQTANSDDSGVSQAGLSR